MDRLIGRWLVRAVGVADEYGETGSVHGQGTHMAEDHEQAQAEEERVSRRPALANHVAGRIQAPPSSCQPSGCQRRFSGPEVPCQEAHEAGPWRAQAEKDRPHVAALAHDPTHVVRILTEIHEQDLQSLALELAVSPVDGR